MIFRNTPTSFAPNVVAFALTGFLLGGCGPGPDAERAPENGSDTGVHADTDDSSDVDGLRDSGGPEDSGQTGDTRGQNGDTDTPDDAQTADAGTDAGGGDASPGDAGGETPTWRGEVEPLLKTHGCPSGYCHGGGKGGFEWADPEATYDELVGVTSSENGGCSDAPRVAPGDPAGSHLFQKLKDTPLCGERMPPYPEQPLPEEKLKVVRKWIEGGAPLE